MIVELNEIKEFLDHIDGRVGEAAHDTICETVERLESKINAYSVLHSISGSFSAYENQLNKIDNIPQTQIDLDHQLKILGNFARKMGLYDAESFIRKQI